MLIAKLFLILLLAYFQVSFLCDFTHADEGKGPSFYYQTGDWKKAIDAYNKFKIDDLLTEDLNRIAEAYYNLGMYEKAEEVLRRVNDRKDNFDSKILTMLVIAKKGNSTQAIDGLRSMMRNTPEDYKLFSSMGLIMITENRQVAAEYFKKALDKNPDSFTAWFSLGQIYEEDEDFENAIKAYKNAVRINPLSAFAQNNLGYCYKERHYYSYAIEHYKKAIELMPDNPGFYYNLGNAYSHQERIEEAFNAYKKAVDLDPAFAKAHYNLGRTYLRKNMVADAIQEFKLYLKYGNREIFSFVLPKTVMEEEIEQLELFLLYNQPDIFSKREMAK